MSGLGRHARLIGARETLAAVAICMAILAAAFVVTIVGGRAVQGTAANAFVLLVIVTGLGIFVGSTGVLSFGHASFAALAGYTSALLSIPAPLKARLLPNLPEWIAQTVLPVPVSIGFGVGLAVLVGISVGVAIMRLAGAAAVIATLGLLIMTNSVLTGAADFTRGAQAIYGIPAAAGVWTSAICACAMFLVARVFKESRHGLLARAARDDPSAARSIGIVLERARMVPWALSIAVVALGGALLAHRLTVISPKEFYFNQSFEWLVVLIVGGVMSVGGNVLGALVIVVIIEALRNVEQGVTLFGMTTPAIFGLTDVGLSLAILVTLIKRGSGLAGRRELDDVWPFRTRPGALEMLPARPVADAGPQTPGAALEISSLSKSYGGVQALSGVSFTLPPGEIVGLIGPNGSGKSTMLGCISGQLKTTSGEIRLGTATLTHKPADRMAHYGVARTFQNIRLFENLTAAENVEAALLASGRAPARTTSYRAARSILQKHGLATVAEQYATTLSYGDQRRLEIARALACGPQFLLLDEPAAGMNEDESAALAGLLREICSETGVGILVVEHDLPLVMGLCDKIVVLEKGQKIAEASPADILRDERVVAAYFGGRQIAPTT